MQDIKMSGGAVHPAGSTTGAVVPIHDQVDAHRPDLTPAAQRDRVAYQLHLQLNHLETYPSPESAESVESLSGALRDLTEVSRYTAARVDKSTLQQWSELLFTVAEHLSVDVPDDLPFSRLDVLRAAEKMRLLAVA